MRDRLVECCDLLVPHNKAAFFKMAISAALLDGATCWEAKKQQDDILHVVEMCT